jgi:hypothetical protein
MSLLDTDNQSTFLHHAEATHPLKGAQPFKIALGVLAVFGLSALFATGHFIFGAWLAVNLLVLMFFAGADNAH